MDTLHLMSGRRAFGFQVARSDPQKRNRRPDCRTRCGHHERARLCTMESRAHGTRSSAGKHRWEVLRKARTVFVARFIGVWPAMVETTRACTRASFQGSFGARRRRCCWWFPRSQRERNRCHRSVLIPGRAACTRGAVGCPTDCSPRLPPFPALRFHPPSRRHGPSLRPMKFPNPRRSSMRSPRCECRRVARCRAIRTEPEAS